MGAEVFSLLERRLSPYGGGTNHERLMSVLGDHTSVARSPRMALTPSSLRIIVLTRDSPELLRMLLPSLDRIVELMGKEGMSCEVVVVDTGSCSLEALDLLTRAPKSIDVRWSRRYHFSNSNNVAAEDARAEYLLFLNNDVQFEGKEDDVVNHTRYLIEHPEVSIVGSRLLFPNGTIQHDGVELLTDDAVFCLPYHPRAGLRPEATNSVRHPMAVTGAYLLVRASDFFMVGGFDEAFSRECQDVDLCLRISQFAGKVAMFDSDFTHIENGTRPKGDEDWADRTLFVRRWSSYLRSVQ